MDWITLLLEAVGVVILLMWIVIPIQEFRAILRSVHARDAANVRRRLHGRTDTDTDSGGGSADRPAEPRA